MLSDGAINSPVIFVSIGVLVIVVAAVAMSAVHRFIDSFLLATLLQLHEHTITHVLGDEGAKALRGLLNAFLIGADNLAKVFRVHTG
jgi:hypothetical protein